MNNLEVRKLLIIGILGKGESSDYYITELFRKGGTAPPYRFKRAKICVFAEKGLKMDLNVQKKGFRTR